MPTDEERAAFQALPKIEQLKEKIIKSKELDATEKREYLNAISELQSSKLTPAISPDLWWPGVRSIPCTSKKSSTITVPDALKGMLGSSGTTCDNQG